MPLLIIGAMFFVIGFGVGISGFLTPALRDAFHLSTGQSYLVTAAIFSAFVIFGRPSAWVITRLGYRLSMVIAFAVMAIGMAMFIPSARMVSFPLFLLALFVGGIGNTLLQAAVNPYVTIIGPIESAAVRMSMMGILNKLAWWMAPLFLGIFIDLQSVRLTDVNLPFTLVALILVLLAAGIYFAPLPEVLAKGEAEPVKDSDALAPHGKPYRTSIWHYPHLLLGVVAIFLYIGIEILPMASIIDFARVSFGDTADAASYAKYVTIGLIAGYLFGILTIPRWLSQKKVLILFSILGVGATLFLVLAPLHLAFYGLLLVSFSNSLMWPAIWPLAIADLGRLTKLGSSLLVSGIVGGGVIPYLFGLMVDWQQGSQSAAEATHYQGAYWIMLPCYLFLLYYALHGHSIRLKPATKTL